jgi:predicted MFS family arabinose efflux permease
MAVPLRRYVNVGRALWTQEFRHGARVVTGSPAILTVVVLGAAVSFTSGAFLVVEPLYARHVLHRPPSQFALFEATIGVGAVLASLVVARHPGRARARWRLGAAAICYGLAASLFVGTTAVAVAYIGAFAWGVVAMIFSVLALTELQVLAAADVHGRVISLNSASSSIADTAGLLCVGLTITWLGIRPGALCLAAVAVIAGMAAMSIMSTRHPRQEPP